MAIKSPRRRRRVASSGDVAPGDRSRPTDKFFHPAFAEKHRGTHLWFDNIDEYIEYVTPLSNEYAKSHPYCSSRDRRSKDWDFGVGWEGANKLARTGWPEGAAEVESLLCKVDGEIRRTLPMQRNTMRPAMVGGRVSVPAFLAGHPKTFLTLRKEAATCKTITMAVNVGASCGVSAQTMMRRGVAIAAVVRALEQRRVRVELVATVASYADSWPGACVSTAVTIKRAQDKLQVDTVAFALAHFAFARRLGFAAFESAAQKNGWHLPGDYGMPGAVRIPDAYNIDTIATYTDEQMQQYVKEQLKTIIAS